jgi:hypothetical protein
MKQTIVLERFIHIFAILWQAHAYISKSPAIPKK